MDKNTYETYEFMPRNNGDAETDQFLVVQDDGTFLLNRQIQYVAQVQDVKEVLEEVQPCAVYGVSQQFYVDVDNTAELISVSDQFILPDADNGLYTNSYLLQPSSNAATTEPMEEDAIVDQFKQQNSQNVDIDMVTYNSKQGNNFTEITLSDEQYQTLEQKGWILLETNEKIYVLNTLGLHDITANDKLIQKLRNDLQNDTNTDIDSRTITPHVNSNNFSNLTPALNNQPETVAYVIDNEHEHNENLQFPVNETEEITQQGVENLSEAVTTDQELPYIDVPIKLENLTQDAFKDTSSIKIKTKYNFKDIPDKIILGKTANGKRLVAKVLKPDNDHNNQSKINRNPPNDNNAAKTVTDQQNKTVGGIHDSELIYLIQETLRTGLTVKRNEQDVASADTMVTQLLRVSNLRNILIGNNLIVTKVTEDKDEFGMIYNKSKVSLVTGRVKVEDDSTGRFEYVPHLLHKIRMISEKLNDTGDKQIKSIEEYEDKENFNIYHVHITETKCADNVLRVSVSLNRRTLPLNLSFDLKKRYPPSVYACSACATLFKTENALKEHQDEGPCMDLPDSENMLTIDTDQLIDNPNGYTTLKVGIADMFCTQCNAKFTKLGNCKRHVNTHNIKDKPKSETTEKIDDTEKQERTQYKCKMCPSTYFHSASLSKHIISRHIRVKSNK